MLAGTTAHGRDWSFTDIVQNYIVIVLKKQEISEKSPSSITAEYIRTIYDVQHLEKSFTDLKIHRKSHKSVD